MNLIDRIVQFRAEIQAIRRDLHAHPELAYEEHRTSDKVAGLLQGWGIEVHMDGGIRSGQDVLKAWALGARGTYIGRAFLYGLGALGEAGVTRALEIIHRELDLTMAFCGRTRIEEVDRDILVPGTFPG